MCSIGLYSLLSFSPSKQRTSDRHIAGESQVVQKASYDIEREGEEENASHMMPAFFFYIFFTVQFVVNFCYSRSVQLMSMAALSEME